MSALSEVAVRLQMRVRLFGAGINSAGEALNAAQRDIALAEIALDFAELHACIRFVQPSITCRRCKRFTDEPVPQGDLCGDCGEDAYASMFDSSTSLELNDRRAAP